MRFNKVYVLVKFGLVLVYILKIYCKKSSSILLTKNMFNSILVFFSEKHVPSQVLKDFSVENLETIPNTFLSKFSSKIFLSRIINYWGGIFTLYLMWGTFVLSVFFSFFLSCFCFSIGAFLNRHYRFTGLQGKEREFLFYLFSTFTRSRTFI